MFEGKINSKWKRTTEKLQLSYDSPFLSTRFCKKLRSTDQVKRLLINPFANNKDHLKVTFLTN
jgi:hypothetical protein